MMYVRNKKGIYRRGFDLEDTALWKKSYVGGYVYPNPSGEWDAYADDGKKLKFIGTFPAIQVFKTADDWYDFYDMMLLCADIKPTAESIDILRCVYMDPRNDTTFPFGVAVAIDPVCTEWFVDYWDFIRFNEHGNEASFFDLGGFKAFVDTIHYPAQTLEYLYDAGEDELAERLIEISRRYAIKFNWRVRNDREW